MVVENVKSQLQRSPGVTEKTTKKPVTIYDIQNETRTVHPPNKPHACTVFCGRKKAEINTW